MSALGCVSLSSDAFLPSPTLLYIGRVHPANGRFPSGLVSWLLTGFGYREALTGDGGGGEGGARRREEKQRLALSLSFSSAFSRVAESAL